MSKRSIARFFYVPPDQRTNFIIAEVTILSVIVPILIVTTSSNFYLIVPIAIVIGVLLTILYVRTIIRRELILQITGLDSILDHLKPNSPSYVHRISFYYDGIPITNLYTVLLKIQNKGNTPIEIKDFHNKSVKIVLPGEIKILNVAIKGKSRTDLNLPEPGREGQIIVIKPFSLPVNQWFNVRLTFDCQGIEFLKKLEKIDIKAEKEDVDDKKDVGDSDSLKINFLKYIDWEEKF